MLGPRKMTRDDCIDDVDICDMRDTYYKHKDTEETRTIFEDKHKVVNTKSNTQ